MANDIDSKLDAILEKQEQMTEALLGNSRPGSSPGLIRRVDAIEMERADFRRVVADLTLSVRALEAASGRTALSWVERVAVAILSLAVACLGALVARTIGGQHP